jgi:hypothetical protein
LKIQEAHSQFLYKQQYKEAFTVEKMSGLTHSALSIVLQHLLRKNVESEIATTAQKQAELRRRIVESNVCQILYPETFPRDNREDQKANMTEYVEKQYAMNPFHADYNIFRKLEIFIQQSVSFRSLLNPLTVSKQITPYTIYN